MSIALPARTSVRGSLPWVVLGLGVVLLVVNLVIFASGRSKAQTATEPPAPGAPAGAGAGAGGLPGTVSLPEGKYEAAGIGCETAEVVALPAELGVPGRIDANQDRQAQVRPRAAGVIREVKVRLGQSVKKGDVLAVLDSPDVGTARLNLRAKQRELATTRIEAGWKSQIAANVAALIPDLRKRTEGSEIERKYANRPLGAFRGTLLPAYAEYDIASHEEEKTEGLHKQKILGEHPAFVAHHNRESAQAKFDSAVETVGFEAHYQGLLAAQQVKLAESNVIDAAKRLQLLGVTEDVDALLAQADKVAARKLNEEDVTAYRVVAPFDATVISKTSLAVPSQKAETTDVLFGLADLSTVWVTASIPESDFALLPALQKGTIRLYAAAYPGRKFEAEVLSVGATVDPATRTVSMQAETRNDGGLLKLGMFVRIVLDTAAEAKALTVPAAAVVDLEGKKGVFVPGGVDAETKARTFAFRAVRLGREAGDRRVIDSGLKPGDLVVTRGAFTLKSELILQNEKDEE